MKNTHLYIATGVAVLLCVIGYVSFSAPKPSSSPLLENTTNMVVSQDTRETDIPAKSLLSKDAEYPTPVVQLQQTLTYGLINAEAPSLPLLKGDLELFAQSNIDASNNELPNELVTLKERLNTLKSISEPQ